MIYFAKPGLWEDFYIVHKEEGSIACHMCDTYAWQRPSLFVRDKAILPSESMLYKDYDSKDSVAKRKDSGREPQGAWCQDELIDGKLPVIK
jgi:hypothetical protein